MFLPENPPYLRPDDDESLDFDLGCQRQPGATTSRETGRSDRPVIVSIVLLVFLGIHTQHRQDSSLDRSARTQVIDKHLAVEFVETFEAVTPSVSASEPPPPAVQNEEILAEKANPTTVDSPPAIAVKTHSEGRPDPDVSSKFEAPIISDATSSPSTEPSLDQSKQRKNPPAEGPKTDSVASAPTIPMSAFPTDERIWTKGSGRYILASALAYDERRGTVMLRSNDGRVLSAVTIEELCLDDLEFLSQLTELATKRTSN